MIGKFWAPPAPHLHLHLDIKNRLTNEQEVVQVKTFLVVLSFFFNN